MCQCVICEEVIGRKERKVRVMVGHLFSKRRIYFHAQCFFADEDKTKEKMRELAIRRKTS